MMMMVGDWSLVACIRVTGTDQNTTMLASRVIKVRLLEGGIIRSEIITSEIIRR